MTRVFATMPILALVSISYVPTSAADRPYASKFQYLLGQCINNDPQCIWYVSGVADVLSLNAIYLPQNMFNAFCADDDTTYGSMVQVVINYGEKHPEVWAKPMIFPVREALMEVWPCPLK